MRCIPRQLRIWSILSGNDLGQTARQALRGRTSEVLETGRTCAIRSPTISASYRPRISGYRVNGVKSKSNMCCLFNDPLRVQSIREVQQDAFVGKRICNPKYIDSFAHYNVSCGKQQAGREPGMGHIDVDLRIAGADDCIRSISGASGWLKF